jgi:N-acetylneuraminic acid mutarotase
MRSLIKSRRLLVGVISAFRGLYFWLKKSNTMKTKILLSAFFLFVVLVSYGQWTRDSLSQGTIRMAGATLGTKAYFAGGQIWAGSDWAETDKVEIYDIASGTWQMEYLTQARTFAVGVTCGDWVFIAGGTYNNYADHSSRVDIFNSQGIWDIAELSVPRFAISAVSNDSLVLFAGGAIITTNESFDVVDIYNIHSKQWSVEHLSEPRGGMGSAVAEDRAFFAGGENAQGKSDRVDIYNFSTHTWNTITLSQARTWIAATAAQNKVIFAGGVLEGGDLSDRVDIYNTETNTWEETETLSMARGFFGQQAVTILDKAYFVGGFNLDMDFDTIDVYDPFDDSWSVMTMPNRLTDHTVVANDTSMLIAGGFTFDNYPLGSALKYVENWTDPTAGLAEPAVLSSQSSAVSYPNPTSGIVDFRWSIFDVGKVTLKLYDIQGREVAVVLDEEMAAGEHTVRFNAKSLPAGIYF